MKIIGCKYIVKDNSFIYNIDTNKPAFLVQDSDFCNAEEKEAEFRIVSLPYEDTITYLPGSPLTFSFINIQSNKTFNVYKVLFNPSWVVKNTYSYKISFIGTTLDRPAILLDLEKFLNSKGIGTKSLCITSEPIDY